ncbi:MAG: glutaminase, partial [Notoacmeibacter sp.]
MVEIDLAALVNSIAGEMALAENRGQVAHYIPELSSINPVKFGLAIMTVNGAVYSAGDWSEPFSIQSISKVFSLTLALGRAGDNLWHSVGREPSGSAFNSIIQLEHEQGRPRNPFINAGAIAVTDVL